MMLIVELLFLVKCKVDGLKDLNLSVLNESRRSNRLEVNGQKSLNQTARKVGNGRFQIKD